MDEFNAKFDCNLIPSLADEEQDYGKEGRMHRAASHRLSNWCWELRVVSGLQLVYPQPPASVCFHAFKTVEVPRVLTHRKLLFAGTA